MGVYSLNRTGLSTYDESLVEADMSYVGVMGCCEAMIDMEVNNHAIFEATIARDFLEASFIQEGKTEELDALTEATGSGVIENIKKMVKKVWAKIKGIFESFIAKLDKVIIRDNKKYVEKYQKAVRSKDLSKMKFKFAEPDRAALAKLKQDISAGGLKSEADTVVGFLISNDSKFADVKDKISNNEYYDFIVKSAVGSIASDAEYKDLEKSLHEACFKDEEEKEGLSGSELSTIIVDLIGDKTKKEVQDAQKMTNKHFADLLSKLDKATSTVLKYKSGQAQDNHSTNAKVGNDNLVNYSNKSAQESFVPKAGVAQQAITQIETVHNKLVACFLKEHKFLISQARRVFAKAVSFNAKSTKNESTDLFLDAVAECAGYEMDLLFDDYAKID